MPWPALLWAGLAWLSGSAFVAWFMTKWFRYDRDNPPSDWPPDREW